jgi:5-methylcytosine-specific restriction endonuclease McrA
MQNLVGSWIALILLLAVAFCFLYLLLRGTSESTVSEDEYLRATMSRRDYYRNVYLKSEEWQRKRYLVLKRDNHTCVHCGYPATDVHHTRYARKIGKEPIHWLEAICRQCHVKIHNH